MIHVIGSSFCNNVSLYFNACNISLRRFQSNSRHAIILSAQDLDVFCAGDLPGLNRALHSSRAINRLTPLGEADSAFRDHEGRSRARFRSDVKVSKIVLVSTGGWWEMGNFGTVLRITEELAKDWNVDFSG
jgi:hypothetical protein